MPPTSIPQPADSPSGAGVPPTPLDRIPLLFRMVVYFAVFLAFVLLLLPYVALQVDRWLGALVFQLPLAIRIVGWALFALCFATYAASSYHLSTRGRGAYVEFDPPKQFVASGPFRWCRNPIAACVLGMLLGEAIGLSSIGVLLLFLIGLPIAHAQVVLLEEPLLLKRFGQPYADYLKTVPRWIPRPPRPVPS
jgi:protein-S-isoprenylcysteine O-methyltransferase Ste14